MALRLSRSASRSLPMLDWLQVEVSSYCNAVCAYCPHTTYQNAWLDRHMSWDTFQKLLPAFAKARLVFLQGWGEPFLNPDFFEMVRLAKASGCQVATTTNGMLLDTEKITRLVQYGVDMIAFSLAGVDEENDVIRKGTHLKGVLKAIQMLNQVKEALGATQPTIHIAYMLLRSRLNDVGKLPALLRGLNIGQVVISTLDFVANNALADEALIPANRAEYDELRSQLDKVIATGERYGLTIYYRLLSPESFTGERDSTSSDSLERYLQLMLAGQRHHTCTENIQRAVFVSSNGAVSPCVYTNLPVSEVSFIACGTDKPYQRLTFGNVNDEPLEAIWHSKAYVAFRRSQQKGSLNDFCVGCPKHRMS